MDYTYPEKQYYFLIIGILVGIYIYYLILRKRDLNLLGEDNILQNMFSKVNTKWKHVKFTLLLLSIALGIIALLGPMWGEKWVKTKERSAEILFILDNSLSMFAEDVHDKNKATGRRHPSEDRMSVSGEISRFELAKREISKIIDYLENNKMGLILVAGDVQIKSPLIFNNELLKNLYLKKAKIAPKRIQGTQLANAIEQSPLIFSEGRFFSKVIILFSDGEDHQSHLDQVLEMSKKENIIIHTVGVGSKTGAPIPLKNGVQSFLTEKTLIKIAKMTGGSYFHLTLNNSLENLYRKLESLKHENFKDLSVLVKKNHYKIFILATVILFILGLFLPENKIDLRSLISTKLILLFSLIFLITVAFTQDVEKGNQFYKDHKYNEAIDEYNKSLEIDSQDVYAYLFRGNSFFRKKEYKKAFEDYKRGESITQSSQLKSDFYYNMGKSVFQMNQMKNALKWYKKSLKTNSDNLLARHNYYLLKKKLDNIKKEFNSSKHSFKEDSQEKSSQNQETQRPNKDNKSSTPTQKDDEQNPLNLLDKSLSTKNKIKTNDSKKEWVGEKLDQLYERDQEIRAQLDSLFNKQKKYSYRYNEKDW